MTKTHKEAIYDDAISPLMERIIELCKEHKIVMFADFSLGLDPEIDENLFCTTALGDIDPDDDVGTKRCLRLFNAVREPSRMAAFTIHSGKKP